MLFQITPFLLLALPLYIYGSVSVMKQYTLMTVANFTWNDAKVKCEAIGGHLAKIDTQAEQSMLKQLDGQPPWNDTLNEGQYWFGLHIRGDNDDCSAKTRYFWNDCEPLFKWADWYSGEPNHCFEEKCMRIQNIQFRTRQCSTKYGALCEKDQGECTFERVFIESVQGLTYKRVSLVVAEAACRTSCLNNIVDDETQCWFYQTQQKEFDVNMTVIAVHEVCFLFFTTNSYSVDTISTVGDWENATTIHIKRCFEAVLDEQSQPDSGDTFANVSEPDTKCPVIGDCYFETIGVLDLERAKNLVDTTLDVHGTEVECKNLCIGSAMHKGCWFVDTFSPLSGACRLYFLHNDLSDSFKALDPNTRKRTLFMKKCLKEEVTTTTEPITTTTPTLVFEELRVEKKDTGNYRRKFISIYEDRPSAMSMGIIGAIFISLIIGFMVLSDIPIFYKHARTIGAKNIRTRNRCFPPRKQTTKTKSVAYKTDKPCI
ncbi:uncharacterized protein LOC110460593 [Mizuhopecten yessoensis]|uniref:uncharacterized protein LOC110460593 n=1 Tax=Mizuhopecten yessoensis TaxID=6573 RepID=UPI000B45BB65|nr:uncharacterized protein LOC110460593 [Mizuhopecten yessoensis]